MHFEVCSTLKGRALTALAVAMWENNLRNSPCYISSCNINTSNSRLSICRWVANYRNEITVVVQNLHIPELLKAQLTFYVDTVIGEILKWTVVHGVYFKIVDRVPSKFSWTPQGNINLRKTAKMLIGAGRLSVINQYKLASVYCEQEQILALWNQMGEEDRNVVTQMEFGYLTCLVLFWSHYISGKQSQLPGWGNELFDTNYAYGFNISLTCGIEAAVRFFLQNIAVEEKDKLLVNAMSFLLRPKRDSNRLYGRPMTDIFCFLLNSVDEERQMEIITKSPKVALEYFIICPWVEYFTELYRRVKHLLDQEDFYELLRVIYLRIKTTLNGYAYVQVLRDFWCQSSITHRKFIIETQDLTGSLLTVLFNLEEWDTFSMILQDATAEEKEKWLTCPELYGAYKTLAARGYWNTLEVFTAKCLLSKEEVIIFRDKIKQYYIWCKSRKRFRHLNCEWNKFFRVLDRLIGCSKRCARDIISKTKRLCTYKS